MSQTIEQEMQSFFIQLNEAEKKSVVEMIKTFLQSRKLEAERITIEQYNKEIDEAMSRVEAGDFTTQEDLEKEMQAW